MGGYNIVAGFLIFFFLFVYFVWFGTSLKIENDKEKKDDIKVGDEIFEQLPPVDFGRIAAQTARQVITQNVR